MQFTSRTGDSPPGPQGWLQKWGPPRTKSLETRILELGLIEGTITASLIILPEDSIGEKRERNLCMYMSRIKSALGGNQTSDLALARQAH
jgi:hypothetical protein